MEANANCATIPSNIARLVHQIWNSKEIKDIFKEKENEFLDTIEYFLNDSQKYFEPAYIPTNEDLINLRSVTLAVSRYTFEIDAQKIHFFDVSGLAYHRTSWISYFDLTHAVLFVVALSSFDQVLAEDPTVNRMADALVLFHQICTEPLLKDAGLILFLNKRDVFQKKIRKLSLSNYFPEYQGSVI
jgi:hypothetical protein